MTYDKTTRRWYMRTKYGDAYFIHADGAIERCDKQCEPSGKWRFTALVDKSGKTVATLDGLLEWYRANEQGDKDAMFYKNGNPRFTVQDIDHGTVRFWGNTACHGIADLRPVS